MGKNKLGKFLAFTTVAAAIGGICYAKRDKIKESEAYQKISDALSKLKKKDDDYDDFDFEDDVFEDFDDSTMFNTVANGSREYTSINITSADSEGETNESNKDEVETTAEEIETPVEETEAPTEETEAPVADTETPKEETEAPTEEAVIVNPSFSSMKASTVEITEETVEAYENEGLSDVYEDPDSLEDQDKLDF